MTPAFEQYTEDYKTLALLQALADLQRKGDHAGFAAVLWGLWGALLYNLPEECRSTMEVGLLHAYFERSGNLTAVAQEADETLRRAVGAAEHAATLEYLRSHSGDTQRLVSALKGIHARVGG
jgi:hypothetical protein